MTERTISVSGCVTYWSLPPHANLRDIRDAFDDCGLNGIAPEQGTEAAVLRAALAELHPDRLIRPIKGGGGYNVVREQGNGRKNHYTVEVSAYISTQTATLLAVDPEDITERVSAEMDLQRARCSRTALATALASAVPVLGGVTLRETGGIYYLPPQAESLWERLAIALEACCGVVIYRLRTGHGEQEVRAIRDAAVAELTAEALRIRDECADGLATMRETTAIARRNQIGGLRDRLSIYENILQEGLTSVRTAIDTADTTASAVQLAVLARNRKK